MRQWNNHHWFRYGLAPDRRQAIIWTNDEILLIGPVGTNFSETLIEIPTSSLKKNAFENVVWKIAAILSPSQFVNRRFGLFTKVPHPSLKVRGQGSRTCDVTKFKGPVSGPRLSIKTVFSRYGYLYVTDKAVARLVRRDRNIETHPDRLRSADFFHGRNN